MSGPTETALDFIEKQEHVPFFTDRAKAAQEIRRRRMYPPLALNRLDEDRDGIGVHRSPHSIEVAEWQMLEAGQKRAEIFFHLVLPRGRNAGHRASMEGSGECQNSRPTRGTTEATGELDQALIGFGAAVTKEYLPLACDFDKTPCKIRLGTCAVKIGGVDELACLPADGTRDLWMRMPERAHGNTGAEI